MRAWAAYTKQHLPQWVFCLLMRITKNNFLPTLRTIRRMLTEDKFSVFVYLIGYQVLFSYSWSTSRCFDNILYTAILHLQKNYKGMRNINLWSIKTAQDGVFTSLYWKFTIFFWGLLSLESKFKSFLLFVPYQDVPEGILHTTKFSFWCTRVMTKYLDSTIGDTRRIS